MLPVLSLPFYSKYVCIVDFKVASSIYRKPWLIEPNAAISLVDLLEQIRAGQSKFEKPENNELKLFANSNVVLAPDNVFDARAHAGYEGKTVAIVPILGALMKENFCGWFGTAAIRNEINKIKSTESIQTIILLIDSPGGTVDGTQALGESISTSKKETIAMIDGMACSAAYWIASSADKIVATSQTDIIGSIGTMISFYDRSQYMEENGIVLREYYAEASKDKNKMMREAVKGNGKLLVKELLNPINDVFLSWVKSNRGDGLDEEETLSGKTFLAEKAKELGLIDEVSSFDTVINQILQKQKPSFEMKLKISFKNILGFLGIKAAEGAETVDLTEDQVQKIEAALPDLETTKAKVTELETAATAKDAKITELEGKVTGLTTERDALQVKVTELGKLDAGKKTAAPAAKDPAVANENPEVDAMEMDFQKEMLNKVS